MKRGLCAALLALLMISAVACAETPWDDLLAGTPWQGCAVIAQDEADGLAAAIAVREGARPAVLLAQDGQLSACLERLIPSGTPASGLRVAVNPHGMTCVNVIFSQDESGNMRYAQLVQEDGAWVIGRLLADIAGDTLSVDASAEGCWALAWSEMRGVLLPDGVFVLDAREADVDTMLPAAHAAYQAEMARQKDDVLAKIRAAYPEESWAGAQVLEWTRFMETPDGLAAVGCGGETWVVLLDSRVPDSRGALGKRLLPPDAQRIRLEQSEEGVMGIGWTAAGRENYLRFDGAQPGLYEVREWNWESDDGWVSVKYAGDTLTVWNAKRNLHEGLIFAHDASLTPLDNFTPDAALAECARGFAAFEAGEPPIIPQTDGEYIIPQPCGARLVRGKYAVYSGPGKAYRRAANGKASVSSGDWVQTFGREGDWALVQYRVSGQRLRFGYVHRSAFADFDALPALRFERMPLAQDNEFMTDNPLSLGGEERFEALGLHGDIQMTRLAALGEHWIYVELTLPGGQITRAFVERVPSNG